MFHDSYFKATKLSGIIMFYFKTAFEIQNDFWLKCFSKFKIFLLQTSTRTNQKTHCYCSW